MPGTGQLVLLMTATGAFLVVVGSSLLRLRVQRGWLVGLNRACTWAGTALALAVLVWHSIDRRGWLPLEDSFDALIWLALVLVFFVLYVQWRRPIAGLDWFVMPIVVLLLAGAAVMGRINPHAYDATNLWSWTHRVSAYGGAAAFAVAGAAGAMYLIANYRLRQKLALAGPNLGSLERLEHLTLTSVTVGFALFTIGAVTGFLEIILEDRHTPIAKIVLSLGVWVAYALVLHSPINPSFRGRKTAVLSIVGFVLMIGTVVAVLLLPTGPR